MLVTNEKDFSSFESGISKEWLIANGLGGYSSSTIIGTNTRKYHGLLVAALDEDQERFLVLSKLNEEIILDKGTYSFSTNECPGYIEKGYRFQRCFAKEYLPEFFYDVYGIEIVKKIGIVHGENKIGVSYTIKSNCDATLRLSPLVNFRSFHHTNNMYKDEQESQNNVLKVRLNSKHDLYMTVSEGEYSEYYNTYYQNMYYRTENERGLDDTESHYMPGYFDIKINKGEEKIIEFVASVDDELKFNLKANSEQIIKSEETRLEKVCKMSEAFTDEEKALAIAADSFVIDKKYGKTIIAGYHWFGDWGRDTFISLEGILLKNNRFIDAKNIIYTFGEQIRHGLIPNLIDENGGEAYNSVDASLWYIDAIYKYYKYTSDKEFVKQICPTVIEIINAYKNGTDYDIKMDKDFLISAGDEKTQLTWMDAKIGDVVPTPRYGKAVEINALWFNALNIVKILSTIVDEEFDSSIIDNVKESFKKFYTDVGLFDTIEPNSSQIRPNQIFAASLEFPVLDKEKSVEVIELIEKELLTNKGLRTLSRADSDYSSRYEGDSYKRDMSYHQGTVWPWLFMGYFDAISKYRIAPQINVDINELLNDRCLGSICEIYDAEEPRLAKGAISQAWSVAMAILNL